MATDGCDNADCKIRASEAIFCDFVSNSIRGRVLCDLRAVLWLTVHGSPRSSLQPFVESELSCKRSPEVRGSFCPFSVIPRASRSVSRAASATYSSSKTFQWSFALRSSPCVLCRFVLLENADPNLSRSRRCACSASHSLRTLSTGYRLRSRSRLLLLRNCENQRSARLPREQRRPSNAAGAHMRLHCQW